MRTGHIAALAIASCLGTLLGLVRPAAAQARVDTVEYADPDRGLMKTGAWTLGLSYVPALVVGLVSPLPDDRILVAPVAGPWIDLARRDCPTCEHETLNKVLLVTDGPRRLAGGYGLSAVGTF